MRQILIKILLKIYNFFEREKQNFSFDDLDILDNFIKSSNLVLLDMGSRQASIWRSRTISNRLDLLKVYSTIIICDADVSTLNESMKQLSKEGWKNIKEFPYAISNSNKKFVTLFLTHLRGLSSLLKPNEYYDIIKDNGSLIFKPKSTIKSADFIASSSCSTTMTVFPKSLSLVRVLINRLLSF